MCLRQTTEEEEQESCLFGISHASLPLVYEELYLIAMNRLREIKESSQHIVGSNFPASHHAIHSELRSIFDKYLLSLR